MARPSKITETAPWPGVELANNTNDTAGNFDQLGSSASFKLILNRLLNGFDSTNITAYFN
jgi:hypothetical protein